MSLDCELREGPSGCHIRTTVNIAMCHYFFTGFYVVCFVYSNYCYPHYYYVDHLFGGSAASLMGIAIFGSIFAHTSACQPIRFVLGILIPLNVLLQTVSTYYYTIERWYDVEVTALVRAFRTNLKADFPDHFWRTIAVVSCINSTIYLIYLPYIMSFMCRKRKLYLFTSRRVVDSSPFSGFSMPSVPSSTPKKTNK